MNNESQKHKKIIVLGLDGVPLALMLSLIEKDIMPNLKSLFLQGAYGNLRSVMPPITPAAWTSFQTGIYPSRHGVIHFLTVIPWTFESSFTNSTHISGQTLWSILNAAKKKQIVVNVPLTYPPEEIDGILIPGFDTPLLEQGDSAYPEGILAEIKQNVGEYLFLSLAKSMRRLYREAGLKALSDKLLEITRSQVNAVKYLMSTYSWDFLMYHFQVTDSMQHFAWEFIDPEDKTHKNIEEKGLAIVQDFYHSIDAMVGEILSQCKENVSICVLSDHGFTAYDTTFYLNVFLKQKGYIVSNRVYPLVSLYQRFVKTLKKFQIPLIKKIQLSQTMNEVRTFRKIDFRQTTAYAYSYALNHAFLFIKKGSHINVDILKKDLLDLRHDGKQIVKDIYPWYEGQITHAFNPDFVIEFSEGYSVTHKLPSRKHIISKKFNLFEDTYSHGNHSRDGLFCLFGDNIKNNYESSAEIVDILPTILNILQLPIPKGIDGTLIEDVFLAPKESDFSDTIHHATSHKTVGNANFDAVAEMLESLGYL